MTIFVVLIFSILLLVDAGIFAYIIYDLFVMHEHYKNHPPKKVFMEYYHSIREQRINTDII